MLGPIDLSVLLLRAVSEDRIKRSTRTTIKSGKPLINPKVLLKHIFEWVIDRHIELDSDGRRDGWIKIDGIRDGRVHGRLLLD